MEKTKVLAIYLPQFHETDYNNEWWGKGYTEWTACKRAKPLFNGHNQPRVPFGANYYDLNNVASIQKQAEMARKYGIDGFAIYHYYSNGKMLLEKPKELFLKTKDIHIEFCLYWANHDWRKNWFGQDKQLLWKQEYGVMDDWINHFQYCLEFFKDERYLKVDNKPVFLIFEPWKFKEIEEFINLWNDMAKKVGFNGVYFVKTIGARTNEAKGIFDACFRREPFFTFSHGFSRTTFVRRVIRTRLAAFVNKFLNRYGKGIIGYTCDYEKCWRNIVARNDLNPYIIPGAVTDWDNSPRKQYNAQILKNVTPEKFGYYMLILYRQAKNAQCSFLIINSWNEWAEGNYLEADEKYGFKFLQKLKEALLNEIK